MLIQSVRQTLGEVDSFVSQLTYEQYNQSRPELGDLSIGQHIRHIIELFQCLINQYPSGMLNYDGQNKNSIAETVPDYARTCICKIREEIDKPDKQLVLLHKIAGKVVMIASNYRRELLHNLEHCMHHQALIRVALTDMENVDVDDNFGVTPVATAYPSAYVH